VRRLVLLLVALLVATAPAWAQETAPAPAIPVTDGDRAAYERYNYMQQLADAQVENLRLRNALALREAWSTLDALFRRHYNLGLADLVVKDGVFLPKTGTPPSGK